MHLYFFEISKNSGAERNFSFLQNPPRIALIKYLKGVIMKFLFLALGFAFIHSSAEASEMPSHINSVFKYQCERTFLEGEGIGEQWASCPRNQRLGTIQAKYSFYLYASENDSNFSEIGTTYPYQNPICDRAMIAMSCESAAIEQFGLSKYREGKFQVGVNFTAAPGTGPRLYGFAALPDSNGNCAEGLEKLRPYVAQPSSIWEPLPSTFINRNNHLNNYELRGANGHLPMFEVTRSPNLVPCDARTGSCRFAEFGPKAVVQTVPYTALTPTICVLPKMGLRDFSQNKK
jgi:hypothetical protein